MDISRLVRNPDKVKSNLIERGNELITKVPCKILIPARYVERGLGTLEPEVYTIGIFALVMEDSYYSVSLAPAMMRLTPADVNHILIGEDPYIEFSFAKGAVVCPNLNLVVRDEMVYYVYSEFTAKGNIPWFMDRDDITMPYENAPKFCGVHVGANHAIMQMVHSSTLRVEDDKAVQYRHAVKTANDLKLKRAVNIPLRSIIWGPNNTFSRIIGSYFKEGLTTALVNPSERVEPIEDIIRR